MNKPNLDSGELEPESLKGFIDGVKQLRIPIADERTFLKDAQKQVFEWAKSQH
ncbi:MAG: hypothetical protein NTZ72_01880 [Afipia sp.]|nr:hypothetical protein [Afipia sp.]